MSIYKVKVLHATALVFLLFSHCRARDKDDKALMVFAAASLTNVMTALGELYQKDSSMAVQFNFASSGTLARQIEHGAQADVYVSANPDWVNYLDKKAFLDHSHIQDLAGNKLVVVSSKPDSVLLKVGDAGLLVKASHIAIGDPGYVPAGKYAREALENLHIFDLLKDKLVMTKDVRSALMLVELGEAEYGIVYGTDALSSKKVHVVGIFPEKTHQPVIYRGALCKNANRRANSFFDFLSSGAAQQIWEKYGFSPLDQRQ